MYLVVYSNDLLSLSLMYYRIGLHRFLHFMNVQRNLDLLFPNLWFSRFRSIFCEVPFLNAQINCIHHFLSFMFIPFWNNGSRFHCTSTNSIKYFHIFPKLFSHMFAFVFLYWLTMLIMYSKWFNIFCARISTEVVDCKSLLHKIAKKGNIGPLELNMEVYMNILLNTRVEYLYIFSQLSWLIDCDFQERRQQQALLLPRSSRTWRLSTSVQLYLLSAIQLVGPSAQLSKRL